MASPAICFSEDSNTAKADSTALPKSTCKLLVWLEQHGDMLTAIGREKELKRFKRAKKLALIETDNPQWLDLYEDLLLPRHLRRSE